MLIMGVKIIAVTLGACRKDRREKWAKVGSTEFIKYLVLEVKERSKDCPWFLGEWWYELELMCSF